MNNFEAIVWVLGKAGLEFEVKYEGGGITWSDRTNELIFDVADTEDRVHFVFSKMGGFKYVRVTHPSGD